MIWVVWRAVSSTLDVPEFLRTHPEIKPAAHWLVGDRITSKRSHDTSGFNVSVAESEGFEQALVDSKLFIDGIRPVLDELQSMNAHVEIDFGLPVGGEDVFAQSIRFDLDDLAWFSSRRLPVVVSAYPCGGDDE